MHGETAPHHPPPAAPPRRRRALNKRRPRPQRHSPGSALLAARVLSRVAQRAGPDATLGQLVPITPRRLPRRPRALACGSEAGLYVGPFTGALRTGKGLKFQPCRSCPCPPGAPAAPRSSIPHARQGCCHARGTNGSNSDRSRCHSCTRSTAARRTRSVSGVPTRARWPRSFLNGSKPAPTRDRAAHVVPRRWALVCLLVCLFVCLLACLLACCSLAARLLLACLLDVAAA